MLKIFLRCVWLCMFQFHSLSASVLQGFSCNSVQTLPQQKIKDLVKACRPRAGRDKVLLKEAQVCTLVVFQSSSFQSFQTTFQRFQVYVNLFILRCYYYCLFLGVSIVKAWFQWEQNVVSSMFHNSRFNSEWVKTLKCWCGQMCWCWIQHFQ